MNKSMWFAITFLVFTCGFAGYILRYTQEPIKGDRVLSIYTNFSIFYLDTDKLTVEEENNGLVKSFDDFLEMEAWVGQITADQVLMRDHLPKEAFLFDSWTPEWPKEVWVIKKEGEEYNRVQIGYLYEVPEDRKTAYRYATNEEVLKDSQLLLQILNH